MERIVEDNVDVNDLKKFELVYNEQAHRGTVSEKAQFDYALCLVRSRYQADMKRGAALLFDLFQRNGADDAKRDYLFYLAIAHTRLKEYDEALKYIKAVKKIEPTNRQASELQHYIEKKMRKEGLMGMAIVGGAALALGGIVGLGMALAKK